MSQERKKSQSLEKVRIRPATPGFTTPLRQLDLQQEVEENQTSI